MKDHFYFLLSRWQQAFMNRCFVIEFIVTILVLFLVRLTFSIFSAYIELREGFQFNDPLLEKFMAYDLTYPIFGIIYGSILVALTSLIYYPHRLMILFEAYALVVLTRLLTMFVLPLAPPEQMIILKDPVVEFIGSGKALANDLFFSGHTATLFLLFLSVPRKIKWVFLVCCALVATGVLIQKVHYTVDVLVAPFISYGCYCLVVGFFYRRYKGEVFRDEAGSF